LLNVSICYMLINDMLPSCLLGSKMSLRQKTTERLRARGMFPSSQYFKGVEGHAGAPRRD
jgi:hypothetical protein